MSDTTSNQGDAPHIAFAGGGTGGHLFPGLAAANALATLLGNVQITFAGSGAAFERHHVSAAGYEYLTLRSRPLRRSPWAWPGFLAATWQGRRQALAFLRQRRVDLVVGLGGYASVPMASAAATRGIPLVLLEQNAIPGRANRWLSRSATSICLGFEAAGRHFPGVAADRLRVTGTPLRVIPENKKPATSTEAHPLLVICGGSGGARPLNLAMPRVLGRVKNQVASWRVLHQTGESGLADTQALYRRLQIDAEVIPFVPDLPRVLARASLAICRSGGSTLAELAAAGVPAILCPYPFAADEHQLRNAEVFANAGAGVLIRARPLESEAGIAELTISVTRLLQDADQRNALASAAQALARLSAAAEVAQTIARSLSHPIHATCIDAESLRGV